MQDRMKMRSVSFSDEAPPAIPPRTFPPPRAAHRRQTSAESLPLYENSEMNNEVSSSVSKNLRLNSLPRMIPHHRRKILDFNRPSSSLAGHYQYLGDPLPDYANLTNISRRGTFYNQRQNSLKQGYGEMDYSYDTDYNSRGYLLNAPGVMEGPQDSGSAYSPCSYNTDASYNSLPRSGTSILKNGSLRSRGRTYESTVLRPMKHTGGYLNDRTYDRTDLGSQQQQQQQHWEDGYNSTSNHYNFGEGIRGNNTGRENGYYDYNNGNATRLQEEHSANTLEPLTAVTKPCLKKSNEKEEELPEDAYPPIAKPSPSLQIIATRNHPCCECMKNSDNRTPLSLLFLIFLVCSSVVITGVMYYLKSDSSTIVKIPAVTNINDLNAQSTRNGGCDPDGINTCPFGGICLATNEGLGRCHCEDTCPYVVNPVCGSDGKSYENDCLLKVAGCKRRSPIGIQHPGECGNHDPCTELSCPKYAKCVPSFDGASASCVCPEPCSNDPVDESTVVCGSNGQDYPSQCHLERVACERRLLDLSVIYPGKCNPCQGFECQSPQQECHVDHETTRQPVCTCEKTCANETAPVCASNGKTYRSECLMKLDACRKKVDLRVIYAGLCSDGLNQCNLLSCNHGQECEIDKQGITNCICNQNCEPIVRPVCANDGNSYPSLCEMQKYGCLEQINLEAKYFGICDSNGPCSKRSCNHHSICVESGDLAFCECPNCSEEYSPVCGGDGVTYDSECKLRREACLKETDITIVENAPCSGCANVTCEFYSVCKSQGIDQPGVCVCPTKCIEEDQDVVIVESNADQVCGTDGLSYPSECQLQIAACKKQQYIVVANKGECDLCRGVNCKHGAHCEQGLCVCPTHCPTSEETLCATDMNTYGNECEMLKAACERNMAISFLHHGPCAGTMDRRNFHDVIPCYGRLPLVDPATGLEYNCGLYGGVECPQNSFCHHTQTFAKCCPKETENAFNNCTGCCTEEVSSTDDQDMLLEHPVAAPNAGPDSPKGCPLHCKCNPLGSTSTFCNPQSGQCRCAPGIAGLKCDRCRPGFWGMPRIPMQNPKGCKLCHCSPYGSVRPDCEQMSGRCICKPGISGDKCDTCPDGSAVTTQGCEGLFFPAGGSVERCGNETCQFGARCKHNQVEGSLKCSCDFYCDQESKKPVCGSDGNTYRSECELQWRSCHLQTHILITEYAPCQSFSYFDVYQTESPMLFSYTDDEGLVIKSTRHTADTLYNNRLSPALVTPSTILVHGLLGEVCLEDSDCSILNSVCSDSQRCACQPGTQPFDEGKICKFSSVDTNVPPTVLVEHTSPCLPNPCNGGGTCEEHDNTYTCFCPTDRTGERCERRLSENDLRVPMFSGNSFVELLPLENVEHKLSIEMEFKVHSLEGILLYAQQGPTFKEGQDFVSLAIVDGHVELRYDLGTGKAVIRTPRRVRLGYWHTIQAKRWHRDGMLKLDDNENTDGHSRGSLRSLDILQPTYIGGLPHSEDQHMGNVTLMAKNLGLSKLAGLHGCIRRFKLGHKEVKIQSSSEPLALRRVSLSECQDIEDFNPCGHQPCLNGGTCLYTVQQDTAPYKCNCPSGFVGQRCEQILSLNQQNQQQIDSVSNDVSADPISAFVPAFTNEYSRPNSISASQPSFLELPTLSHVSKAFHIEVWFLAKRANGLILYNGQNSNGNGDFLAINLVNGHVQLRYDLGSGVANLTSPEKVAFNQWHSIKVTRNGPYGTLQLNTGQVVSGMSPGSLTELNLELPLYLGGYRFAYTLNKDSGVVTGLEGALQRLIVNGNAVEDLVEVALDSRGISRYVGLPCDSDYSSGKNELQAGSRKVAKCKNGGICTPFFRSYVCKCKADFIGPKCEKSVNALSDKSAVQLDGKTFLKFTNKMNKIIDITEEVWVNEFELEDEALFGPSDNIIDENDTEEDDIDLYGRRGEKRNKFIMNIRTTVRNGLVLWMNQGPTLQGDFLAIAVIDGKAELSFNLGKKTKPVRIKSKMRVDDGQWHRIRILRKRRIGVLQVDKAKPSRGKSEKGASILNTDGKIWIGGKHSLPSGLPTQYYHGFIGCLKNVKVFRRHLDLLRNGDNSNVKVCGKD